ncbi:TPA: hypothetical protein ACNVP4_006714, partial [Pseudomonas aeruginosa]
QYLEQENRLKRFLQVMLEELVDQDMEQALDEHNVEILEEQNELAIKDKTVRPVQHLELEPEENEKPKAWMSLPMYCH